MKLHAKMKIGYSLKLSDVVTEQKAFNIQELDIDSLKGIANGVVYLLFSSPKDYIIMKTGLIDYWMQFQSVIIEIENGNKKPFSVSCDWYSNSIKYVYSKETDHLQIIDVNNGEFSLAVKYTDFKKACYSFIDDLSRELILFYPSLSQNIAFKNLINNRLICP